MTSHTIYNMCIWHCNVPCISNKIFFSGCILLPVSQPCQTNHVPFTLHQFLWHLCWFIASTRSVTHIIQFAQNLQCPCTFQEKWRNIFLKMFHTLWLQFLAFQSLSTFQLCRWTCRKSENSPSSITSGLLQQRKMNFECNMVIFWLMSNSIKSHCLHPFPIPSCSVKILFEH